MIRNIQKTGFFLLSLICLFTIGCADIAYGKVPNTHPCGDSCTPHAQLHAPCTTETHGSPQPLDTLYQTDQLVILKLDENLFMHVSFLKQYNNFPCNGMVYLNNGEAVVFDTPTDDSTSLELINWLKNEQDCQIKAIVINHFHIDCLGGLDAFHQMGIPSFASEKTVEFAHSERAQNEVVPQHSFQESQKIEVGDTYIENRYFGAGHTTDNIVSYVAEKKALFGGCMIKSVGAGKGNLKDANTHEWPATVQKIKAHYTDELEFVVPGHGAPGGVELLDFTMDLFGEE